MPPSSHRAIVAFAALCLAALSSPVAAQDAASISGLVTDQTGASVAGARVELLGSGIAARAAATNAEGRYRFDGLPPGDYRVRATAQGFQPLERRVTAAVSATAAADFRLAVQTLQERVLVTAEQARAEVETARAFTPGGVTIVEGDELARRHINGLADMLRYVPGVWAESRSGSDELFFSSRGSNLDATDYDRNGVKLLQDGLPVTTADGNNHNRVIDPLSARYTTVARGANALTYGASTLGGAIDFVSPTARNSAPFAASLDSGSHGSLNARATFGASGDRVDGLLTVEGMRWDGYRDHSEQERWGMYANTGLQVSDTTLLRVFGTYVDNDQRLPGALTRAEVDADRNRASSAAIGGDYGKVVTTGRVAAKATWTLRASGSLSAGLSYEAQSLFHPIVDRIFVDVDGPGPLPPFEVFSLLVVTDHRDLGAVARYNWSTGAHDLLVGLNYGTGSATGGNYRNLNGRPNGISQHVDNTADSVEAFVLDRWRASGRLTLSFGAQVVSAARDVRTTNATTGALDNPADRYSAVNPRAGVIVALNEAAELYGNVSRLYEAPTTFEMEDDVRGGNATLAPMTGAVAEVGLRSRLGGTTGTNWSWDITAYYARISDEILSMDDPFAPGNSLTTNIDGTVHAGIEALVRGSLVTGTAHRVDPMVSVTLNRFGFAGDPVYGDNDLPAAPTYAVRGEVVYRHASGVYAGPTFDLVGRRYADFANTYTVDSHQLMGLRLGVSGRQWEMFGEVRNLFDTEYIGSVGVLNTAGAGARVLYPGAPRSAYAGLRFSY